MKDGRCCRHWLPRPTGYGWDCSSRSIHLQVSYEQPDITRDAIGHAIDAGFEHVVLGLPYPYPVGVAQWVVDELITRAGS